MPRTAQIQVQRSNTLRNLIIAAGFLALAPYVIRRVLPLINRGLGTITGNDVLLAGKDSVRDAADDLNVGGLRGTLKRAGGRIADHVRSDI